ncbi:ribonuclease HIII [Cytobacillus sp. FSL W8-0315]|jgi:ribonuclease HIII|uniref:ribonuclease HIII n=1 Tax=Cytobacillus TaxID=2675230 RepID=UPI001C22BA95|nr:ribonuclease HIII [Cytobacillus oceanisediminis]MBU8770145.1 ribonuclease HIII [Cytobacillus oceanisediminis]MBY0155285.1 ribonuclease HIII [Cytobacillus firmus]
MSQVVLLKKANEISEMKAYYSGRLNDKLPPGSVFAAKVPGCSITAYKSGKVLFQGSGSETEAKKWGDTARSAQPSKKTSPAAANLPENISSLSVIGSDEVGTGDYFGPITVVAAYVKKDQIPLLKELGVKDSKNLGDEKIIEIAKQIKDIVPHSLLTLHNEKYNKLQQSGMSQGKIKALLHNQAIGHVLGKIAPEKPEAILIDQFAKEEVYFNYLKNQQTIQRERVFFSTKAEGIHLAVAAASILARYAFVRHFENLSTKAGFRLTKGAGPKVDEAAARLIRDKGREALPSFVKLHFANTEKAMKLYSRKYN